MKDNISKATKILCVVGTVSLIGSLLVFPGLLYMISGKSITVLSALLISFSLTLTMLGCISMSVCFLKASRFLKFRKHLQFCKIVVISLFLYFPPIGAILAIRILAPLNALIDEKTPDDRVIDPCSLVKNKSSLKIVQILFIITALYFLLSFIPLPVIVFPMMADLSMPVWYAVCFAYIFACIEFFVLVLLLCFYSSAVLISKRRGLKLATVMAWILCFLFPFGTVIGIYSLSVLKKEKMSFLEVDD